MCVCVTVCVTINTRCCLYAVAYALFTVGYTLCTVCCNLLSVQHLPFASAVLVREVFTVLRRAGAAGAWGAE